MNDKPTPTTRPTLAPVPTLPDLLAAQRQSLERLEAKLGRVETLLTSMELALRARLQATPPTQAAKPDAALPERICAFVSAMWTSHQRPVFQSQISQRFAHPIRRSGQDLNALLAALMPERLASVFTATGACLYFPAEAWNALNEDERLTWANTTSTELRHEREAKRALAAASRPASESPLTGDDAFATPAHEDTMKAAKTD